MRIDKRLAAALTAFALCLSLAACAAPQTEPLDACARSEAWIEEQIRNDTVFSFSYGGEEFSKAVKRFEKTVEPQENGWILTYRTPEGVVARAEIGIRREAAVLEWCCFFQNEGEDDSPVLENIRAMDSRLEMRDPVLTTARGSDTNAEEFQPVIYSFAQQEEVSFGSSGGRSSEGGFPYFDVCAQEGGVLGAVGWTGQWTARFSYRQNGLSMDAGMAETRISLHAQESMRTPSILLLFFDGSAAEGHNLFRRLMLEELSPRDGQGQVVRSLPDFLNLWGGSGEAALQNAMDLRDRLGIPYDGVWIDAGWSGTGGGSGSGDGVWYRDNGNLYVNRELYPNGLKPISDRLHQEGRELLLWFEPERAFPGTQLVTDYPQYYLPKPENTNYHLFNLGNDEACDFLIDWVSRLISENGVDWYRQDFNISPLYTWQAADRAEGENRVGITEIKYITNLYRFLDALREKNPGLRIDNCASGGKRLDLEMMRRSVPLWRTDYSLSGACTGDTVRSINYNLSYWLPLHAGGAGAADGRTTTYNWRAALSAGLTNGTVAPDDRSWYASMQAQYQRLLPLLSEDYTILSQGTGSAVSSVWGAYEFFAPQTGEGCLLIFRPGASQEETQTIFPQGLKPEAQYALECVDTGWTETFSGRDLTEKGLSIELKEARSSLMIFLKEAEK